MVLVLLLVLVLFRLKPFRSAHIAAAGLVRWPWRRMDALRPWGSRCCGRCAASLLVPLLWLAPRLSCIAPSHTRKRCRPSSRTSSCWSLSSQPEGAVLDHMFRSGITGAADTIKPMHNVGASARVWSSSKLKPAAASLGVGLWWLAWATQQQALGVFSHGVVSSQLLMRKRFPFPTRVLLQCGTHSATYC